MSVNTDNLVREGRIAQGAADVYRDLGTSTQIGEKETSTALKALKAVGHFFKRVAVVTTVSTIGLGASPIILLTSLAYATIQSKRLNAPWAKVTRYVLDTFFYSFLEVTGLRSFTRFSKIDNQIYLGAIPTRGSLLKELKEQKITDVLAISEEFEFNPTLISTPVRPHEWREEYTISQNVDRCDENTVQFHHLPSEDFKGVSIDTLHQGADAIHNLVKDGKKVYIHCKAGLGRSPSVLAAYYIKHKGKSFEQAINFIQEKRPCINLGKNHRQQLKAFANSLEARKGLEKAEKYYRESTYLHQDLKEKYPITTEHLDSLENDKDIQRLMGLK